MDKNLNLIFKKYFKENEKLIQESGPLALVPLAWSAIKFYTSCAIFPEAVDGAAILASKTLAGVGIGDGNYNPQLSTMFNYDPDGEDGKSADYYSRPPYAGPGMIKDVGWLTTEFVSIAQGAVNGMNPQQYVDYLNKFWVYPSPNMLKQGITYTWSRAEMIRDKFYYQWVDDVVAQGDLEAKELSKRLRKPGLSYNPRSTRDRGSVDKEIKAQIKALKKQYKKKGQARAQRIWEYWIADPRGTRHPWIRFTYRNGDISNGMFVVDPKGLAYTIIRRFMFESFRGSSGKGESFTNDQFSKNRYSGGRTVEQRYKTIRLMQLNSNYPEGPISIYKNSLKSQVNESEQKRVAEKSVADFETLNNWVTWIPNDNRYQNEMGFISLFDIYKDQASNPNDVNVTKGKWVEKSADQLEQDGIAAFSLFPDEGDPRAKGNLFGGKNLKKEFELLFKGADFSQQHGYNVSPDKFDEQHVWSETVDEYWKLVKARLGKLPPVLFNSLNPRSSISDATKGNPAHKWMKTPNADHGIEDFVYGLAANPDAKECRDRQASGVQAPCSVIQALVMWDQAVEKLECSFWKKDKKNFGTSNRCAELTGIPDLSVGYDPIQNLDASGVEATKPDLAMRKIKNQNG